MRYVEVPLSLSSCHFPSLLSSSPRARGRRRKGPTPLSPTSCNVEAFRTGSGVAISAGGCAFSTFDTTVGWISGGCVSETAHAATLRGEKGEGEKLRRSEASGIRRSLLPCSNIGAVILLSTSFPSSYI